MPTSSLMCVRPFSGQAIFTRAVPCRTRVVSVRSSLLRQSPWQTEAASGSPVPELDLPLAISVALGALGASSRYASASEVAASGVSTAVTASGISADDVRILAAASSSAGQGPLQEAFVAVLFGIVVSLLVVVTGGVAYINIKQFLDGRQEKEDRDKEGREAKPLGSSSKGKGDDDLLPPRRTGRIKKEKGKGFAAQEFTSRR